MENIDWNGIRAAFDNFRGDLDLVQRSAPSIQQIINGMNQLNKIFANEINNSIKETCMPICEIAANDQTKESTNKPEAALPTIQDAKNAKFANPKELKKSLSSIDVKELLIQKQALTHQQIEKELETIGYRFEQPKEKSSLNQILSYFKKQGMISKSNRRHATPWVWTRKDRGTDNVTNSLEFQQE